MMMVLSCSYISSTIIWSDAQTGSMLHVLDKFSAVNFLGLTLIGHPRAGMGYRNEFQTENYGPLTNQALFPIGCALSHIWDVLSMLKFAHVLDIRSRSY